MNPTERRYPKEVFAERGDAIYERDVRPCLKPEDDGRFVAIDIETGAYEIDDDELTVCRRLHDRIPDAQPWLVRVGYRSVHRFGGRDLRRSP